MAAESYRGAIDCHAHAFPSVSRKAKAAAEVLPAPVGKRLIAAGRAAKAAVLWSRRSHADEARPTQVEQVAQLRDRLPKGIADRLEAGVSAVTGIPTVASGSMRRLLASMDRHGVAETVVIAAHDVADNDWLLTEGVAEGGDRVIPVAILPHLSRDSTFEAWADGWRALAERGAQGFKLHANLDDMTAEHPAYRAAFAVAEETGRFVIAHTGCFAVPVYKNKECARPAQFEPLMKAHPGARVCLAHMNRTHPEEVWPLMKRYEQVYADTSWQTSEALERAFDAVGDERILLGSDWPLLHDDLQADAMAVVARATAGERRDRVMRDNAKRFLGRA